jgi:hypothetical protein
MITGSWLVLYFRLNLILSNRKFLRVILITILGNAVVFQLPDMVITYISGHANPAIIQKIEDIFPKFDIIFTVQEVFLSSLYIFVLVQFLTQGGTSVSQDMITTFCFLILAEVAIFILNIVLNILLYLQIYLARRMLLGLFYAIQLKIEFIDLNRLVVFAQRRQAYSGSNVEELQARNTMMDMFPIPELSGRSKVPTSSRLDALGNSSESPEAELAVLHLAGSSVQRAEMEEDIITPISFPKAMPGNTDEGESGPGWHGKTGATVSWTAGSRWCGVGSVISLLGHHFQGIQSGTRSN